MALVNWNLQEPPTQGPITSRKSFSKVLKREEELINLQATYKLNRSKGHLKHLPYNRYM
jgi:hypothetical protein